MRGAIFKYEFVANLPVSLSVKKLWKSVRIWGSYGQEFSVLFLVENPNKENSLQEDSYSPQY